MWNQPADACTSKGTYDPADRHDRDRNLGLRLGLCGEDDVADQRVEAVGEADVRP